MLFEIIQKTADDFNGLGDRRDAPPVWAKDGTRVGGYEKLDQIVESPTGYKKLNALLSGMSIGTCQAYLRGWRHWVQYCRLRGCEPCLSVGGPGWGENISDFIMFENTVLGLKPSTAAGKLCDGRYFHIIHGRPDFTLAGVRCKFLLKSLTRRQPSVQKLPYNMDLLNWLRTNFVVLGMRLPKIREVRAGLNPGFFFLMGASGAKQIRQKDVEIGTENGKRELTIFIYRSKTDQGQRGCFRTSVETQTETCPVRSMIYFLNSFDWECESEESCFQKI